VNNVEVLSSEYILRTRSSKFFVELDEIVNNAISICFI
jgi:hypothetical protein